MRRFLVSATIGVLLVAAVGLGAWAYVEGRRADRAARARQAAERARLEAEGLVVAERETASQLRDRISALTRGNADLESQLEQLQRVSPGARPELVVEARAEPVRVSCPEPESDTRGGANLPPAPPPPSPNPLLTFEPGFTVLGVETEAGNQVLLGEIWGAEPGTNERLWQSPIRADVTRYWRAPPRPRPLRAGWGVRVEYLRGWRAGPAWSAPPLRWRGLHLEATADVTLGEEGLGVGVLATLRQRRAQRQP